MKLIFVFILSGLITSVFFAQDLYLCKSYTEDGKPIEVYNNLEIKPWGTAVYILVDNNSKPFNETILHIFIDKRRDNEFQAYESLVLNLEQGDSWFATGYEFKDPGEYEIYCLNADKKRLASKRFKVIMSDEFSESPVPGHTGYYENSKFSFCEAIIEGKPVNIIKSFNIKNDNEIFYIYLNNKKPLRTEKIILHVWRKKSGENDYTEFIESKYFKLDSNWSDVFFKYSIKSEGEYRFDIYNEHDTLIAKNYIKITR